MNHWIRPTWGQSLTLLAASLFTPMRIWASNLVEIGLPEGLLIWSGINWLLGLALWLIAVRLGGKPIGVTYSLFWFLLAIGSVGSLREQVPGGSAMLLIAVVLFTALTYRFRDLRGFRVFSTWAIVYALLLPFGIAVSSVLGPGESRVEPARTVHFEELEDSRDVVAIVLDGYGSYETLSRWYGVDDDDSLRSYAQAGLTVATGMKANYTLTHLSLASFFDMDYPIASGIRVGDEEWADLLGTIQGDNQLVRAFKSQGYRLVLVESGWSAIRCTGFSDVCIRGVWPDDATTVAIHRSIFGGLPLGFRQESFVSGSLNSIDWLRTDLEGYVSDGRKDFIFVHVMIPHPPMRLDANCDLRWVSGMDGRTVGSPDISPTHVVSRKAAYVDQTRCAQKVIFEVATMLDQRATLVAFGDHGPDSQSQLFKAPEDWTPDDIEERLGVFFVTNADRCDLSRIESLTNVGRGLLSCLSGESIELIEDRYFIALGSLRQIGGNREPVLEIEGQPESSDRRGPGFH